MYWLLPKRFSRELKLSWLPYRVSPLVSAIPVTLYTREQGGIVMKLDSTDSRLGPLPRLLLGLSGGGKLVMLSRRALTHGFCSIPGLWEKPRGTREASHVLSRCSDCEPEPMCLSVHVWAASPSCTVVQVTCPPRACTGTSRTFLHPLSPCRTHLCVEKFTKP